MAPPSQNSRPRLAIGCRWSPSPGATVLLYPEGAIRLQGTGLSVAQLCDGFRTFDEIITLLLQTYPEASADRVRNEAASFLEKLQAKRLVDYDDTQPTGTDR